MVASKWRCNQPNSITCQSHHKWVLCTIPKYPQMVGLFFGLTPEVRFDDFQSLCKWMTLRIYWHHNVITSISHPGSPLSASTSCSFCFFFVAFHPREFPPRPGGFCAWKNHTLGEHAIAASWPRPGETREIEGQDL